MAAGGGRKKKRSLEESKHNSNDILTNEFYKALIQSDKIELHKKQYKIKMLTI